MDSGADCPTAVLVDLSANSEVASPITPVSVTPYRKCKKPRNTEKGSEKLHAAMKEKEVTEKYNVLSSLENIAPLSSFSCSNNDCPTAVLVDLSNPDVASPITPGCGTPHRKSRKPRTTEKWSEKMHTTMKEKEVTEKCNVLSSLEKIVPLSSFSCSNNGDLLEEEKFDFDVSLDSESPFQQHQHEQATKDDDDIDDDEVFIGEVTAKEECIAKLVDIESGLATGFSPLTTTEMMILEKEANAVASVIKAKGTPMKNSKSQISMNTETDSPDLFNPQGTKRKLDMVSHLTSPKVSELIPEKDVSEMSDILARKQAMNMPTLTKSNEKKIGQSKIKPLQRSASMRLQRSTDSGTLSQRRSIRAVAPRQYSSQQAKEETSLNVPLSVKKSSLFKASTMQSVLTKQRKLKTTHAESDKASNGCLPRGPVKATEPVKAMMQKTMTSSNKGGQHIVPSTAIASQLTPRITRGTQDRRSMPSSNTCQSIKSQVTGIPRPRIVVTPKKTRLSSISTDENTPVSIKTKRGSFMPSLCRKSSFNSTRSLHTTGSSTGSSVGSVSSDVNMNSSRGSNSGDASGKFTVASTVTRRSLPSPTAHLSSKLKPLKLSGGNWKK